MPCPLFQPTVPLGGFAPDSAPLGDLYGGECAAAAGTLIPLDTIRQYCNFGYARAACDRAAGVEADATRFLVQSHAGGSVHLAWVTEANHHPLAVGAMSLSTTGPTGDRPLDRQARAHMSSYLRRTGRS
ncbi:MAG: hypothetical protein M3N54_14450 [Acidobacteriota bacterium]|nr:hypothetical protein [Acidobacteriota bacterium]